jgi:hypothetical protein
MDNSGAFVHPTSNCFGYAEDDATLHFDLVLDNCFNRQQQQLS